ncbi:MAG TPA: TIGR03086 family metal-binding protein [Amycolatopsis sp.]|uniref:TIGR03086 family metal-binding protein n=1 Tax=Amycolatopsis sp. TaxID=37632 RepID=UPI002B48A7E3|nr:TIGR03086 family metal-binding protein [Amycolatopsis sp.]HKS47974.1 TIGR03086 family metal-binding protein [Amycolatopsis sp.]
MIDLKPACQRMIDLLAGATDDQLTSPSPCTEYTVRDLIGHVDQGCRTFTAIAQQDEGELARLGADPDVAHLGPDWRDDVARHAQTLGKAWDNPEAWQGSADVGSLNLSNGLWGKIALTELVVHGWDIAKATKQSFDLPEQTLQACFDHVAGFVPNAPVQNLWAPPTDVAPDATLLDRIVAMTGRVP